MIPTLNPENTITRVNLTFEDTPQQEYYDLATRSQIYTNTDFKELDDCSTFPDLTTVSLVCFVLASIGFTQMKYDYPSGLQAFQIIKECLDKHQLGLCPQVTGPQLIFQRPSFNVHDATILSEPIPGRYLPRLYQVDMREGKIPSIYCYAIGQPRYDEQVIAVDLSASQSA